MYIYVCFLCFIFFLQEQNGLGDFVEVGESKISYIDVLDKEQNYQYVVFNVTRVESDSNIVFYVSYYSSVLVLVEYYSYILFFYVKIRNFVLIFFFDKNRIKKEIV